MPRAVRKKLFLSIDGSKKVPASFLILKVGSRSLSAGVFQAESNHFLRMSSKVKKFASKLSLLLVEVIHTRTTSLNVNFFAHMKTMLKVHPV